MNSIIFNTVIPIYTTRNQVYEAAKANVDYFHSFNESLKNAWKFYKRKD